MSGIRNHKIFVGLDNTAAITCNNCCRQKVIPVSSFKGRKSQIKIKCCCKNVFTIDLEFRKKFRKKTELHGIYTKNSLKNKHGSIVVTDLTLEGLGFTTNDLEKFTNEEKIGVSFSLDNPERTTINKDVIVRSVRKNSIGGEFIKSKQSEFESSLGFYLMF